MEFALTPREELVPASKANRRKVHHCPACQARLILRRGLQTAPHFAHLPHSNCALASSDEQRTLYRERYLHQQEQKRRLRAEQREYYAQNSERIRAYQSLYREEHREHLNALARQSRQDRLLREGHQQGVAQDYRVRQALDLIVLSERRRARQWNRPDNWSVEDWLHALDHFEHRCAVCGKGASASRFLAADHWIPLAYEGADNPGTVSWNMVPLCHGKRGCNNSKGAILPYEWLQKVQSKGGQEIAEKVESYLRSRYEHYHPLVLEPSLPPSLPISPPLPLQKPRLWQSLKMWLSQFRQKAFPSLWSRRGL